MQSFKYQANKLKSWVGGRAAAVSAYFSNHKSFWADLLNALTVIAFVIGILALASLIWLYVRPVQTANIKVPVATDQASYSPGDNVSGIFFGDTYYNGEVRILREVFCKDYKGVIKPPAESAVGNFFSTQARPRHLEGTTVPIGSLPADVPIGSNCVLQFTNVYDIQTPFGMRHVEYQYYTQNFAIVTPDRREQLDCEATGNKNCDYVTPDDQKNSTVSSAPSQSSPETTPEAAQSQPTTNNTYNSTTNNTTNNAAPTEPAPRYEERCTVNALGIKIGCRQVQVN